MSDRTAAEATGSSGPLAASAARVAFATAGAAAVLLAFALLHGVSQGAYQIVRPADQMATGLVTHAVALRLELGVDFLFLILYGWFFAGLPRALAEGRSDPPEGSFPARFAAVALLVTAVLDAVENAHLLAELASAEQGLPIAQGEIVLQAVASQVKFVASYAGLVAVSYALDPTDRLERLLAFVLRWVQAPIGVAIFVTAGPVLRLLYLTRSVFFVVGMAWIGVVLARRARGGASSASLR